MRTRILLLISIVLLALAMANCDDDATTAEDASAGDVATDGQADAPDTTAGDTAVEGADDATVSACLPDHQRVSSSSACLQDDAVCYEVEDGDWCTGTVSGVLSADCIAAGAEIVSDSDGSGTCPDGRIYLGGVQDVNCLCSCCR